MRYLTIPGTNSPPTTLNPQENLLFHHWPRRHPPQKPHLRLRVLQHQERQAHHKILPLPLADHEIARQTPEAAAAVQETRHFSPKPRRCVRRSGGRYGGGEGRGEEGKEESEEQAGCDEEKGESGEDGTGAVWEEYGADGAGD